MKWYHGSRDSDEDGTFNIRVWVEAPGATYDLPLHLEVHSHSPTGFNWGYGGSGPAQLALAILYDLFQDEETILPLYQDFKWDRISLITSDDWSLNEANIRKWVDARSK